MGDEWTLREAIRKALEEHGEAWKDVEAYTLTEMELDRPMPRHPHYPGLIYAYGVDFDPSPFTAWTVSRVYFSLEYDGTLSVGSVSRHPGPPPEEHV